MAEAASFILVSVLTSLGYTLVLSKSSLVPSRCVRFLGYLSDSVLLAFVLPEDKKLKFKAWRESILSQKSVDLKTLQRFAGQTTSFSIAVPAARLYTRASFRAISSGSKSPHKSIYVAVDLLREIQYWRFLDNWQDYPPWFDKRYVVPSKANPADAPSGLSSSDCMLSLRVWIEIEKRWGPNSVDLMVLDSNTPLDAQGHPLKHFTPWPTKHSAGVNVFFFFSQTLHQMDNPYVFPPLALMGILLRF